MATEEGQASANAMATEGDWDLVSGTSCIGSANPMQGQDAIWDWVLVAPEIAERDQDHVPVLEVLATFGRFAVPVKAETTIGEIRQKVHEWKPEYCLEQLELVCKDSDGWDGILLTCCRPRLDDETVTSLWSNFDAPGHSMQVALWIKEKNEETGEWQSAFWKAQLQIWREESEWRAIAAESGSTS